MRKPELGPALILFLLAPVIGELVSGSSPPLEFFNPVSFLLLAALYGSGAVVMRELRVRWQKGFLSLFLFGAAYGVIEEGLMVKSFFDPNWMDLGYLGTFGRFLDVNWVWAQMLTIYHATFSITIPVILVELTYPNERSQSWVRAKTFMALVAVLTGVTIFGFLFLTPYRPPPLQYVLATVAVVLLLWIGKKVDVGKRSHPVGFGFGGKTLFAVGLIGATSFFLLYWAGPYIVGNPVAIMALGMTQVFIIGRLLRRFDWSPHVRELNLLTVTAGALSFLVVLDFLQETRPGMTGMALVGISVIAGLFILRRKIRARNTVKDATHD